MPQFKPGIFSKWRFFQPDADRSQMILVVFLQEKDPAKAAWFPTEQGARDFLDRFEASTEAYLLDRREAKAREIAGIKVRRVIR